MKRIILVVLCLAMLVSALACGSKGITLTASKTAAKVGDEITFTVAVNGVNGVKSCGFRPEFDSECFELKSGKMLVTGKISEFSNGIGVAAFDEAVNMNQKVFQFVLVAKKSGSSLNVGCQMSFKNAEDNDIVVSLPADVVVTVKG